MRALWVNPSFLDYRVPVYKELSALLDGQLTLVYSKARTPGRVIAKIESALGDSAIGLAGERRMHLGHAQTDLANKSLRVPYQPGLLRLLMKIPADVIIAEGFGQWTPAALLKRLIQKQPFLISYERTHHTERECPRWRTAYRKLVARYVDVVLCSGLECRNYVESLGIPAERTTLGHMVADTNGLAHQAASVKPEEREALRRQLGIKGVFFLFVGQLIERKGVSQLLAGWNLFEKAYPDQATLILAGAGRQRADLEAQVAADNLRNVRFVGYIDYDHIAVYYAAADVFVLPTLEDNWALVVPEAMSCGLPVLCSKYTGSSSELVMEGKNGWTFDPLDPRNAFFLFEKCLQHRGEFLEMGEVSRRIVADHSPQAAALSILEAIKIAEESRKRAL